MGAASAEPGAATVDPATALADRAFAWVLADFDNYDAASATDRCLALTSPCAPGDLLDLDTNRVRLMSLVALIDDATDPAAAGYLGRPNPATAMHVAEARRAAEAAAAALSAFVSLGCAGSIDGVAVAPPLVGCGAAAATARRSLSSVAAVLDGAP